MKYSCVLNGVIMAINRKNVIYDHIVMIKKRSCNAMKKQQFTHYDFLKTLIFCQSDLSSWTFTYALSDIILSNYYENRNFYCCELL